MIISKFPLFLSLFLKGILKLIKLLLSVNFFKHSETLSIIIDCAFVFIIFISVLVPLLLVWHHDKTIFLAPISQCRNCDLFVDIHKVEAIDYAIEIRHGPSEKTQFDHLDHENDG